MGTAELDIRDGILQGHLSADWRSSENTRGGLGKEKHLKSSS